MMLRAGREGRTVEIFTPDCGDDKNCRRLDGLGPVSSQDLQRRTEFGFVSIENKGVVREAVVTLGSTVWRLKCDRVQVLHQNGEFATDMTETNNPEATEEIILPENLLPLGSVLGQGVTPLDACIVLAKVFHVQYTEVAMLRLEDGLLRFIFPEHLRTTGAIPISGKAIAAHTALSKKAEIFNNFARVKHASIFEAVKPTGM